MFGSLKNSVKNITTAILEKVSPRRQEPETDDGGRQHLGHKNREGFVGLKRPRPRER